MTRSINEIKKIVSDLGYTLIDEYLDRNYRRVIISDKYEYKYNVQLNNLINPERGISFVEKRNPFSLENISLWLKHEGKTFELCEENEYKGNYGKLWFHCLIPECNQYFDIRWNNIYCGKQGCPFCSGKRVSDKNRLSILFPTIASEWNYNLNNDTPNDVSFGAIKDRWWTCKNGHEYHAQINNRTNIGSGCPICAREKQESEVAIFLKQWFSNNLCNVQIEYKIIRNPNTNSWLWYDVYLGMNRTTNGIYIEIHGEQHYIFKKYYYKRIDEFENSRNRDRIKKNFAQKNGIYIEVDLRKIKTTEQAIEYVENIIENL